MINIIVPCTPNYAGENIINTIKKDIDIVSQFVMLYNSIKDNWKFDYKINLFYNQDFQFNETDREILADLDIDIYAIESDCKDLPYMIRCNGLTHKLKNTGTHRLLLDCDMVALNEPDFDLSCDWQAMFEGNTLEPKFCEYINKSFGYDLDLSGKITGNLFFKYNFLSEPYENLFPHFNGGAFLIREELCSKFKEYTMPSYAISHDTSVPHMVRHMGVQYGASFALVKMSDNWKPFKPGVNYSLKAALRAHGDNGFKKLPKKDIKLLHYCGTGAYSLCTKYFSTAVEKYKLSGELK